MAEHNLERYTSAFPAQQNIQFDFPSGSGCFRESSGKTDIAVASPAILTLLLSIHRIEELAVILGIAQLVEQEADRIHGVQD